MSVKKRVVILSAFNVPGLMYGAEQFAREICQRLAGRYDITLVTVRWKREWPKTEEKDGYRIVRVGIGVKIFDKFFYPLLAAWKTRQLKPDIAHANIESFAGAALLLVKYFYPRASRILTLQSGNLDVSMATSNFLIKAVWHRIHLSAGKITAISGFLARRAVRFGFPEKNIAIIPNGVDLTKVPRDLRKEPGRVVCVARLSWEKGLEYLLNAWPTVLNAAPEAKLVLVGEGSERPKIEAFISSLKITASVSLAGERPHQAVLEELAKAEVFVCPSLAEGLGIVFIEAQACGAPVIGTRVGGVPDVIQDGENGLLVEPKDQDAVAAAIIKLLKDKGLAEKLRTRALETVKKYDWQNIIWQISVLYDSL